MSPIRLVTLRLTMNWSRPVIHTQVRHLAKLATGMQTTIGPLVIYFWYHGYIPRLYPVKDNRRLRKKRSSPIFHGNEMKQNFVEWISVDGLRVLPKQMLHY